MSEKLGFGNQVTSETRRFSEEMLPTRFIGLLPSEKIVFVRVLFVAF